MATKTTADGSILIAHLADTHLRDSQYITARRGDDFFEAAKSAVEESCKKADLLVIVGDIFDRSRPSPKVIGQLMQLDRILQSAGKAMLAVTGNHDWCSPTWLSTLFPGRLCESGELPDNAAGIIPTDDRVVTFKGFTFVGIKPYGCAAFRHNRTEIEAEAKDADVVLYHGLVDGILPFFGGRDPLHVNEFPVSPKNKAWLLGDIHIQGYIDQKRPDGGSVLIGYPGSTEMCSASEPTEKSVPVIRLDKNIAKVQETIPLSIRPFISAEIKTEQELDELVIAAQKVAEKHPVIIAKFNRELTQTINRLHAVLDAQRAVIRCHPLPTLKANIKRELIKDDDAPLTMDHFVKKRFKDRADLEQVAVDLLTRGDSDAANIVASLIETRLDNMAIREAN